MKITDKQKENLDCYSTDKFRGDELKIAHAYGPYYNELFEPLENKEISILEIGIFDGGSVKLFADYFKNGKVVGVDINNRFNSCGREKWENLSLYFFNAYDLNNVNQLPVQKYDIIIIDDGPHTVESQVFFLSNFSNYLNDGGKLIVEDVPHYNIYQILNTVTCDKLKVEVYDWHDESGNFDDVIIEFSK